MIMTHKHYIPVLIALMTLGMFSGPLFADELLPGPQLILAQADQEQEKDKKTVEADQPRSGTIVFPNSLQQRNDNANKKCMTVCTRWGEDCIIDPIRGRKCRRMCKEFGEECF